MAEGALARRGALGTREPVAVGLRPAATRCVFRGSEEAAGFCGGAFGCDLPVGLNRAETNGARAALSLGPDEWLLLAEAEGGHGVTSAIEAALRDLPHSLVDVSHRQVAFDLSGAHVEALISTGCPLDLHPSAFPVGMASRTMFAKVDVTLWRIEPHAFRMEVARSFAPYLMGVLRAAQDGLGPGGGHWTG